MLDKKRVKSMLEEIKSKKLRIFVPALTLREMKGSFLWSPVAILTGTNSNSKSFSWRETITRCVAVDKGLPWTLMGAMICLELRYCDDEEERGKVRL